VQLKNQAILVTRPFFPDDELVQLLKQEGAKVIHIPSILIHPIEEINGIRGQILQIMKIQGVILFFSSKNAVRFLWEILKRIKLLNLAKSSLMKNKIIAIGPRTAFELKQRGISKVLLPEEYSTNGVLSLLSRNQFASKTIVLFRSNRGNLHLKKKLSEMNWNVSDIPVYKILSESPGKLTQILDLIYSEQVSIIIFTSSFAFNTIFEFSKLRNQEDLFLNKMKKLKIAAIGPTTETTLRKARLEVKIVPEKSTIDSLIRAMRRN